ncbi:hypothetical protein AHAS_Ahas17G0221000 [Arachis hypogaea]
MRTQKGAKAPVTSFKTPCYRVPSVHQLQPLHPSLSRICSSYHIAPVRERKVERHVHCSFFRRAHPGIGAWLSNRPGVVILNLPPCPVVRRMNAPSPCFLLRFFLSLLLFFGLREMVIVSLLFLSSAVAASCLLLLLLVEIVAAIAIFFRVKYFFRP